MQTTCVAFIHYGYHCLPCPEGVEIGWVIYQLDQVPGSGVEQVKEWYTKFPVKASACIEYGVCLDRCPFDVDIIAKMHADAGHRTAAALFEEQVA
jgi:predicted aldo/keto reductase-like oxidoreductase